MSARQATERESPLDHVVLAGDVSGLAYAFWRRRQGRTVVVLGDRSCSRTGGLAAHVEDIGPLLQEAESLLHGERTLVLGQRTRVMAVLNVTPDSFSDGGRYPDPAAAGPAGSGRIAPKVAPATVDEARCPASASA